ncbi:MAG: hypothetical protein GY950_13070 [bacterium]|nr:hypothetical protein [bacterium]
MSTRLIFVVLCFVSTVLPSPLGAHIEEQAVSFHWQGREHRVEVQPSAAGTDIILTGPAVKNLSLDVPGENLFPLVTVNNRGSRFTVSWMHYQRDNVRLCLYDSLFGHTRMIPLENFKSASPLKVIFEDDIPFLLLFKGNNSGNADIFYYHLHTGAVKNITQTADSEQTFEISDEENRVFIETRTLFYFYRYRLKKKNLWISRTKKVEIRREKGEVPAISVFPFINTILGFGDSITYGVIRMDVNDPEDYYHPEQAYLAQLQQIFTDNYGETAIVNRGVSRNTSWQGIGRMDDVFSEAGAYFGLVMFGTNDVVNPNFDADVSTQNLQFILDTARNIYDMYPIISTIPPQKNEQGGEPGLQYFVDSTETLNAKIIEMAAKHEYSYIDTYTAFMEHPDGWETLLELVKGNHPSPQGHQVMANLFKEKILELPPAMPGNIVATMAGDNAADVAWAVNEEFDFSHYQVEYGYSADDLNRSFITEINTYRFLLFPFYAPFYSNIYYRLQAVDKDGNTSDYTPVGEIGFN